MTSHGVRSTPERVTFGVAVAILSALGGSIIWLWSQPREPAIVTVEQIGEPRVVDDQTYVTARVRNRGDETAEAVQVQAELTLAGEVIADGEQATDFLSGGETEELVFIFDTTSSDARIEVRVAGFLVP